MEKLNFTETKETIKNDILGHPEAVEEIINKIDEIVDWINAQSA